MLGFVSTSQGQFETADHLLTLYLNSYIREYDFC